MIYMYGQIGAVLPCCLIDRFKRSMKRARDMINRRSLLFYHPFQKIDDIQIPLDTNRYTLLVHISFQISYPNHVFVE